MRCNSRAAILCAILAGVLPWCAARADSPVTVVYPTGVFPDDVQNVQAAVAAGGEVLLEAADQSGRPIAFNFGPVADPGIVSETVVARVDVVIRGTTAHGHMTTINGGYEPIIVGAPHVRIEGLRFVKPYIAAIYVFSSSDVVIVDNVIQDVVGYDLGDGTTVGYGILVDPEYLPSASIGGRVLIVRNVIDDLQALLGYGIDVTNLDADVTIDGNRVSGTNLNGILVGATSGHASVVNNLVIPGPQLDPNITSGNGIVFGHPRGGTFSIRSNRVICVNPFADGIAAVSSPDFPLIGSEVLGNNVTMHGSLYGGISLYDTTSDVLVADNEIKGDGAYALQIGFFDQSTPASAIGNEFADNKVRDFSPAVSDIFFDVNAADTVLCDQAGSLNDNGVGTKITSQCVHHRD
jgi:hypothetical protein